mmetsp:Transcript_1629/g.3791  ORF Transcript_1629/g.3791 Transcript_1629/m.3791 type:complete len:253 (-) Transcript_1629:300-1058(-)
MPASRSSSGDLLALRVLRSFSSSALSASRASLASKSLSWRLSTQAVAWASCAASLALVAASSCSREITRSKAASSRQSAASRRTSVWLGLGAATGFSGTTTGTGARLSILFSRSSSTILSCSIVALSSTFMRLFSAEVAANWRFRSELRARASSSSAASSIANRESSSIISRSFRSRASADLASSRSRTAFSATSSLLCTFSSSWLRRTRSSRSSSSWASALRTDPILVLSKLISTSPSVSSSSSSSSSLTS